MRSKSILVLAMVLGCLFGAADVEATTYYNDGEIHNIDWFLTGNIGIVDSVSGKPTVVNMVAGGSITGSVHVLGSSEFNLQEEFDGRVGWNVQMFGSSRFNMYAGSNGSVGNSVFLYNSSEFNMYDGSVSSGGFGVFLRNSSRFNMYGGSVGSYIIAMGESSTYIGGGVIGFELLFSDTSELTVYGTGFNYPYGTYTSMRATLTGTLANGDPINNTFELDDSATMTLVPEPATPPVADANGPYTIYVGDTLTLDASGSTDVDGDIVSYMWDLDDDETFETDAGGQAVFDVNYADLQSLGLLVDHTYNIHVQVTDSEAQSDTADSTLIIVPKPALAVAVDIKPGSCPNPVNVKSSGVLPVAILGTEEVNVLDIVPTSIRLAGVEPLRNSLEDVAGPISDGNDCNCITEGPDGFLDLTLKFKTQRIVEAVGDVNDGDELVLELTGVLSDETPIEGSDCVIIRGRHKPLNKADFNGDGIVDMADFAAFAENWLQSSIVEY